MGLFSGSGAAVLLGFTLAAAACSGSSSKNGTTPPPDTICDANARRCDGLNVKLCSADGLSESIDSTCLPNETCADGACSPNACVPNTKFCKDGAVWKCDSAGAGSMLSSVCPSGKYCRDDDGAAYCSDQACTPGKARCEGNVATRCAADGSGPQPGGTDCAANKQACVDGSCQDVTCMPGSKLCQQGAVYQCSQDGTKTSLLLQCTASQVCDGKLNACRSKQCDPGTLGCDGSKLVKCNEFGSDWDQSGKDCASSDQICVAGACKKQVCTANSSYCQEGTVYQCDPSGTSSTLYRQCNAQYEHCLQYNGTYANCVGNDCVAGKTFCDYNTVKVCNADGSAPSTGTVCADDQYCDNGTAKCVAKVCDPYTYYCSQGDIYYCTSYSGPQQGELPVTSCLNDTKCQVVSGTPNCVPMACTAGEVGCIANQVGTCAATGDSLASVTDDCAKNGNVCTADQKCAKSAADTLGVAEDALTEPAGIFIGNMIQVTSTRKLTEFQLNLLLASARELRWVIYEQSADTLTARFDKVVSNQTGNGFVSSGTLNYTLKAGKTYVLGVVATGGNMIGYFDNLPYASRTSFGEILGRTEQSYSSSLGAYPDSNSIYQMKTTTELP